jgi:DNA-binding response OmpR family regulator
MAIPWADRVLRVEGDVLVVDGDPDLACALAVVIEDAGYDVRIALDGQAALKCVEERRPALILLDARLPEMDAITFEREVRTRYGDTVVIDLLVKPIGVEDVLGLVQRHIGPP